jgi:hypothetical protein
MHRQYQSGFYAVASQHTARKTTRSSRLLGHTSAEAPDCRVHCPRGRPLSPDTARQAESALPATDQTARRTVHSNPVIVASRAHDRSPSRVHPRALTRTEKVGCQWTNLAAVRSAPTQRDQLAGRQSVRERCVGVQADSARVITPQRPSDRTRPPWTPVRMAADPSAPVTCLRTARAPTSAPLPLLPVPVACLESGSTTLPSGRQRASILGVRAVADSATALGVSESRMLPARACAVGAGGPRQGFLSDGASFRRASYAPSCLPTASSGRPCTRCTRVHRMLRMLY